MFYFCCQSLWLETEELQELGARGVWRERRVGGRSGRGENRMPWFWYRYLYSSTQTKLWGCTSCAPAVNASGKVRIVLLVLQMENLRKVSLTRVQQSRAEVRTELSFLQDIKQLRAPRAAFPL